MGTPSRVLPEKSALPRRAEGGQPDEGSSLKANQTLIIPLRRSKMSPNQYRPLSDKGKSTWLRKRDTLAGIARKTGVSIAELREINRLPGSALKIGQKLSLEKPEPEEQPGLLAEYTGDEAENGRADGAILTPDEAWAEIERRKKENAALLGKWSSPDEPKLLVKAAMGFLGAPTGLEASRSRGSTARDWSRRSINSSTSTSQGRPMNSLVSGCASRGAT